MPSDVPTIAYRAPFERLIGVTLTLLTIAIASSAPPLRAQSVSIPVQAISQDGQPLAGAIIEGHRTTPDAGVVCSTTTDVQGHGTLEGCGDSTRLRVSASLQGFFVAVQDIAIGEPSVIKITLTPAPTVQQSVTVQGSNSQNPLAEASSSETTLSTGSAKSSPLRPSTVIDTLPLVPGVIRTPDGRVQVSGVDEVHSSLLINAVNVNDPATGDFGLGVPVDSVDLLRVMQSPYLAQYGSFTAGVVSADTRPGGDKWEYSLNDPLPELPHPQWTSRGAS